MATSIPAPSYKDDEPADSRSLPVSISRDQLATWLPLVAVLAVALFFNVWGLTKTGYGNTYYAAAVRSMTESWHNFFFGAFDPGGFITVDKPPVFLWIDALFARIFGYSSTSLLLPSAIAGTAAVGLLWLIVRRYFGVFAARSPAWFSPLRRSRRSEPAEPARALLHPRPDRRCRVRPAVVGEQAVGALAHCCRCPRRHRLQHKDAGGLDTRTRPGARTDRRRVGRLALLLAAVPAPCRRPWRRQLVMSLSWMLVVDNWPGERPYIGGSQDNSVQDLIVGYNGLERVEGFDNTSGVRGPAPAPAQRGGIVTTGRNGPGGIIAGEPDLLRMFDAANGGQIAWFLPFALIGGAVSLWRWRENRSSGPQ